MSALLFVISVLLILWLGSVLDKEPEWLAIALAICGAVLQTAVLGLIYEVWLRNDVEDATLEKLGTARAVREHGLVSLRADTSIDWADMLSSARRVTIVSHDPRGLLGRADDAILQRGGEAKFTRLVIAVPCSNWDEASPWLRSFKDRWEKAAPTAEFFAVRLDSLAQYELIATENRSIILLPSLDSAANVPAMKMLEFRNSEEFGIGAWLCRQFEHMQRLSPEIGYSPPKQTQRRQPAPQAEARSTPEELT
ncbi:hypothetical protein AB0L22_27365 [Micromonospora haikouensis]|uniref:hypothetical protein n=1 Tax=Micromonospora haikouensis TaxID=686309 RepID=UPI003419C517